MSCIVMLSYYLQLLDRQNRTEKIRLPVEAGDNGSEHDDLIVNLDDIRTRH